MVAGLSSKLPPGSLGDELAAASASGGFEPAALVAQDEREDPQASGP